MSKRRRRKGRGGHGGGNHHGGGGVAMYEQPTGIVPTDEQLELELAEFEKEWKGKFEVAKKDDLNLSALQKMTGD